MEAGKEEFREKRAEKAQEEKEKRQKPSSRKADKRLLIQVPQQ